MADAGKKQGPDLCTEKTEIRSVFCAGSLTDLLRIFRVGLGNDVMGTVFGLHVGLGQVLADDPKTKKLETADKNDHADCGSPARHRIAPDQTAYYDQDHKEERETGHQHSEPGGNA